MPQNSTVNSQQTQVEVAPEVEQQVSVQETRQVEPVLEFSPQEKEGQLTQAASQPLPVTPAVAMPSESEPLPVAEVATPVETSAEPLPLADLDFGQPTPLAEKKVSALSLSSIRARKEMEMSLEKKVVNPDDLPKEPFTYEQLMEEWNKYAEKLARSGFMLMSSLMGMVPPVMKGTSVSLEMPNEGSKLSFDENKFDLVNYLRKKLSNYELEIEIIVNEEVKIQKKILDKEDKLVRFIELNPAMQYMKELFDLEFKY